MIFRDIDEIIDTYIALHARETLLRQHFEASHPRKFLVIEFRYCK